MGFNAPKLHRLWAVLWRRVRINVDHKGIFNVRRNLSCKRTCVYSHSLCHIAATTPSHTVQTRQVPTCAWLLQSCVHMGAHEEGAVLDSDECGSPSVAPLDLLRDTGQPLPKTSPSSSLQCGLINEAACCLQHIQTQVNKKWNQCSKWQGTTFDCAQNQHTFLLRSTTCTIEHCQCTHCQCSVVYCQKNVNSKEGTNCQHNSDGNKKSSESDRKRAEGLWVRKKKFPV